MAGLDPKELSQVLVTLQRYADKKLPVARLLELDHKDEFPLDVLDGLYQEIGLHLLFIPEELGGMGGGATCATEAGASERCGTQWIALLLRGGAGIDLILRVWRVGVLVGFRFGYQSASCHLQYGDGPEIGAPEGPFFRVVGGPFFMR